MKIGNRSMVGHRGQSRRTLRFVIAGLALACAFGVSVFRSQGRWHFHWDARSLLAQPELEAGAYDLSSIVVLNRVLLQLQENYVDTARFDAQTMLAGGLDEVQKSVAEVVTVFDRPILQSPTQVVVRVGGSEKTFDFGSLSSLWEMSLKYKEIFRFVQIHLKGEVDLREVEYAAINGMLKTLDPHSVLLSPETYRDMLEGNRGNFGGLGIVVRMLDGVLTVVRPMGSETPAVKAGIERDDQIVEIDGLTTLNMSIQDAVELLRGEPGTVVRLTVQRPGAAWSAPRDFSLTRAEITVPSVESVALADQIGYVRVKGFQSNTHKDLVAHLGALSKEMGELRGLVLDLRGNPGGLLEQAILVADEFVKAGTIVTTVGSGRRYRKPYPAKEDNVQPFYPIVVLIDSAAASASEIVAGALKHLDRAMVVGDTSFGKGSVQVLYELQDGSALKLTIAQYLTSGDVSIQSVGIVPDIKLVPMRVSRQDMDLYLKSWVRREATLGSHLDHESAQKDLLPFRHLRYLADSGGQAELERHVEQREAPSATEADAAVSGGDGAGEEEEDEEGAPLDLVDEEEAVVVDDEEEITPAKDPQVRMARDLLLAAGSTWERPMLLENLQEPLAALGRREDLLLTRRLATLGIDWSDGNVNANPHLEVSITPLPNGGVIAAGEEVSVEVVVRNVGSTAVHRVVGMTASTFPRLDDKELIFGRIDAGEVLSREVTARIGSAQRSRHDEIKVNLHVESGLELSPVLASVTAHFETQGAEPPDFAVNYMVVDQDGNGDGLATPGELLTLRVVVSNRGRGAARRPLVFLKNRAGKQIAMRVGRERPDPLPPGGEAVVDFVVEVREVTTPTLDFEIHVQDTALGRALMEEIQVQTSAAGQAAEPVEGTFRVTVDLAKVWVSPHADAPCLGELARGAQVAALRRWGDYVLVQSGVRMGWVRASEGALVPEEAAAVTAMAPSYLGGNARMHLTAPLVAAGDGLVEVRGELPGDVPVKDYQVFVYSEVDHRFESRKVTFAPLEADARAFATKVPLRPGLNRVNVILRQEDLREVSESVYVFRN